MRSLQTFYREKRYYCNGKKYMEVDVYPYTYEQQAAVTRKRAKKEKVSEPKQKNLNEKRAKRYCVLLAHGNFSGDDYAVHLTYDDNNLPKNYSDAQKNVESYLRKLRNERKRLGLSPLKYILVTQEGAKTGRIHHHLLINGGLDRDFVEKMWRKSSRNASERVPFGWANCRRIQPNNDGINKLVHYITKSSAGKKMYTTSQNLVKPVSVTNDYKYSRKKVKQLSDLSPAEFAAEIARLYPDYTALIDKNEAVQENEITGTFLTLKFYRKE